MVSDRLFKLAFDLRKAKLWNKLNEMQIFAVKLSEGGFAYVSVLGGEKQVFALSVYVGDEQFQCLYNILNNDYATLYSENLISPFEFHEGLFSQHCLQCEFICKEDMGEDALNAVKEYARKNGIRIAGKNAYPNFLKFQPHHFPWKINEEDDKILCEVIEAALELKSLLDKGGEDSLDIPEFECEPISVPCFFKDGDSYDIRSTALPEYRRDALPPAPEFKNDISAAKLKKFRSSGTFECKLIRQPRPSVVNPENEDEVPVFPMMLMVLNTVTGELIPVQLVSDYECEADNMLENFADAMIELKKLPRKINVSDERTYNLLESFCERMGVKLSLVEELPALEEAEEGMWDYLMSEEMDELSNAQFTHEEVCEMLDFILQMDPDQLVTMPPQLVMQLKAFSEEDGLPEEVLSKLHEILDFFDM